MEKEMNNNIDSVNERRKRRKILLSVLMILFTGVVLTLGTYAWFTANKTVTVSNVDVNVAASNGLQISTDAVNWKTVITNSDITDAVTTYTTAKNQLPSKTNSLIPVSTVGDIDSSTGYMNMFAGEIDSDESGNYILTSKQTTEKNGDEGDFVAFDLFFQVREETDIYLTNNSSVRAITKSKGIENAARVAFVDEGALDVGESATDIQKLKGGSKATTVIWEPNIDVHTASAIANASSNYGITGLSQTGASQLSYNGVKAVIPAGDKIGLASTDSSYFGAVTPKVSTTAAGISDSAFEKAFTLAAGVTKVRVYMWIEGQDVDCENNASGGDLSFNLQFSSNANSTGA